MSGTTSGILLVDKPGGMTSHDVVSRTRKALDTRKVGHAGTLDPMATGLLILGANSSTRLLTYLVGLDKQYLATIRLGAGSTTDDAEGELGARADAAALARVTDEAIATAVTALTGPILQRPSAVSAIKVDGRRAYALVRAGEEVVLPERPVTISAFDVLAVRRGEWIDVDVRVDCSSGTYVRALARDLGDALGVGGHLTALRRTRVGPFRVEDATAPGEPELHPPAEIAARLLPVARLDEQAAADLANGKRVPLDGEGGPIAAVAPDGRLVGLVEVAGGRARVLVNFPTDEVSA
ncbi:tRNA pseudouridine(55) synthase TruB [Leifsonia sp. H3M29-4]|uniref:tRNA pseudouridine(55) synthase TruB n=1 Tax=Salinibacterium metalliresistens TaxID=3031321 RepID=UPI0023DB959C|nr:tRNA pseudouridine(55) synthase TruB [Salinibacterium metalliresistens]MDF1480065.1 tRNA pseudouridine(55) synthase TruB [Salinibacterium metalliresistens]